MEWVLRIGLSNALAASLLALLAAAVGVRCRRPAVVHGLWLLVLLKLVTPPLVAVPVLSITMRPAETTRLAAVGDGGASAPVAPADPENSTETAARRSWVPAPGLSWPALVLALWGLGSLSCVLLTETRGRRFQGLLRFARRAPAWLQAEAEELGRRLGLRAVPGVWLMPGPLSPMLWAVGGRPRLLLPAGLLDRLDAEQRATLLAHELAHLVRGDHWVRSLESLVTILYWWHPVVWWARRELREAEELCCDAWVVWLLPDAGRSYALALVETVDFLSEVRSALPEGASGVGHVHNLRRRITMIMRGATPRALTWTGGLALLALGSLLLPLLPTWAQAPPPELGIEQEAAPEPAGPDKARADQLERARTEVEKLRKLQGELEGLRAREAARAEKARAQLQALEAELKAAQERLAELQGARPVGKGRMVILIYTADGQVRRIEVPEGAGSMSLYGKGRIEVQTLPGAAPAPNKLQTAIPSASPSYALRKPVERGTAAAPVPVQPPPRADVDANTPYVPPVPPRPPVPSVAPPAVPDREKRLLDLEERLHELTRELDGLRKELHQQRTRPPEPKTGVPAPQSF